jgi:hypothetical protein
VVLTYNWLCLFRQGFRFSRWDQRKSRKILDIHGICNCIDMQARGVERRLALNALSANGPGHIRFPCQGIPEPGAENEMERK